MFKSIDKKLEELGFYLVYEDDVRVHYERCEDNKIYHTVLLALEKNGKHTIRSYDENPIDSKGIDNVCIGLTYYEMQLFMKKMQRKGWTHKK